MISIDQHRINDRTTPTMNLSGSGVLWINSGVNREHEASFSYDAFVEWYEEVHIGDVMEAGQLPSARRYARVDRTLSKSEKPFLVIYDLPDLSFGSSEAFRQIPMGHARLPGGGPIGRLATFHAVFGRVVKDLKNQDVRDTEKTKAGPILVSEFVEWENDGENETKTRSETQRETEIEGARDGLDTPVSGSYLEQSRYRQMAGWVRSTEYAIVGERWVGSNEDANRKTVGNTTLIVHEMDAMEEMDGEVDGVNKEKKTEKEKARAETDTERGEISRDDSAKESRESDRESKTGSDGMDDMRGEIGDITRGRRVEQGLFRLVRTWER